MSKTKEFSKDELEKQIKILERNLLELRKEYMKKTGQLPARNLGDFNWRWTIFMTLGFAFISSIVYLLGIAKIGISEETGIPSFFFHTDIAYFSILTLYVIVIVLVVQSNKINGYQTIALISGFWCAHWLIYDWSWWALRIGMGTVNLDSFWTSGFGSPIVIPHPPMWMFLLWAILGGIMAFYTFTIPKSYKELLPPTIWLYTGYPNASICAMIGITDNIILIIGIILIIISFSIAAFFTIRRLKGRSSNWDSKKKLLRKISKIKDLNLGPLTFPWIFIIIGMLIFMYPFLVLIPVIGLFLGFTSWMLIPLFYVLFKGSSALKYRRAIQIIICLTLVCSLIVIMVGINMWPL
ncbi:MAG: uL29 family ribosomal protein [Promethearchaeota archaeon]